MYGEPSEPPVETSIRGMTPFSRAVIKGDAIYLQPWIPPLTVMNAEAPTYRGVHEGGVRIVDVARDTDPSGVRSIFLIEVQGHSLTDADRDLIVAWAENLGYDRVFLDGLNGIVELSGLIPAGHEASVTCDVCGATQRDSSVELWRWCARLGRFPTNCFVCNSRTRQWSVELTSEDRQVGPAASLLGEPDWRPMWDSDAEERTTKSKDPGESPQD